MTIGLIIDSKEFVSDYTEITLYVDKKNNIV